MKTIPIDLDVYNYLTSKGLGQGETATEILRRELSRTIEVDDDMYAYILSLATEIGESASTILRRELGLDGTPGGPPVQPPVQPPTILAFHIQPGTGGGPWNTRATMLLGVAGQTLRIHNDDVVPHRPHTPTGGPFPHAAQDIAPGTSADFVLRAFDPGGAVQSPVYDHDFGPAAMFWIKVTEA